MASVGGSSSNASNGTSDSSASPCNRFGENGDRDVPQWKRELIQRRRQQGKVLAVATDLVRSPTATVSTSTASLVVGARGGAAVAAVAAVAATAATAATDSSCSPLSPSPPPPQQLGTTPSTPGDDAFAAVAAVVIATHAVNNGSSSPDMRLEAAPLPGDCVEELVGNGRTSRARSRPTSKEVLDIVELAKMRASDRQREDCESDSSEELQYGPGIVHKLRSKYLNMTLREMNKNRGSIHGFRRAASLEDLLEHNEESAAEKTRRYAKKNAIGAAAKVERYRNAVRGNESMKRARSVETLMRYNSAVEESAQNHTARLASNIFKQESDHIILVDRSNVRIENRLLDKDRLKPINKPKRIKPVLAETERPPPDLVKTTMRIFESSSVKKLRPKGDVAVKVATFKTINDTFKAQNQKKIIPKPPLQPKPLVNGNFRISTGPRKIIITRKPTAELIEKQNNQESYRNDGVITDPIVQSVSSVVSKFQQIEKSCSPSSSPEPSFGKIKFSPVASPEPSAGGKTKVSSLDLKSPMTTPIPSPRMSPSKLQSPVSPRSETIKQPSTFVQKPIMNSTPLSNKFEQSIFALSSTIPNVDFEQDKDEASVDQAKETLLEVNSQNTETVNDASKLSDTLSSSGSSTMLVENLDESIETVDNPRTVSKSAMDNISKAGMTVQFRFNDHSSIKSYLPRTVSNPEQIRDKTFESDITLAKLTEAKSKSFSFESDNVPAVSEIMSFSTESFNNLQERFQADAVEESIRKEDHASVVENKPVGAISSLSLIKSTTTTSFPQGNETKTIRSQKSDSNSPPQKQIGIIRPLVSTKTQLPQQNLSNREIEKNLINKVKSIEQPTKVVVSLKNTEEIEPAKKNNSSGGLWNSKPWNQQNNTMVFNFSNRKDVPDYIENDGLIIKKKRDKSRAGNSGVIVSNIDSVQLTDDSDTEASDEPPSPCNIAFCNDNILINGRSNLSRTPRNHKHRIQFDDAATCTFEYPSEASLLEVDASGTSSDDGETSASGDATTEAGAGGASAARSSGTLPSLLGGGGLASYTPSKVDLASEGFELGVTRATVSTLTSTQSATVSSQQQPSLNEVDYSKPSQDTGTWGQETAADMLY